MPPERKYFEELEAVLDQYFPKGNAWRGGALMLGDYQEPTQEMSTIGELKMFTCMCGKALCGTDKDFDFHLEMDCSVYRNAVERLKQIVNNRTLKGPKK